MDHACPHLRVAGGADEDDEDDEDGADGADGAAEFAMGIDPTQPVYVFELGSGSARLAYNVVTRLAELTRGHRWLRRLRIVYVMTDFARKNVDFWMRHAPLQPLFEGLAGGAVRLDCAILDTQRPYEDVALLRSGVRLGAGSVGNPLVTIANYFCCVVEQDAFVVDSEGRLCEALVTTRALDGGGDAGPAEKIAIERLRKTFAFQPLDGARRATRFGGGRAGEALLNDVLTQYATEIPAHARNEPTSFLVPLGTVRALESVARLCAPLPLRERAGAAGRPAPVNMLALISDKGCTRLDECVGKTGFPMSCEGSFSFMANMDALARWCVLRGGTAARSPVPLEAQGSTCLTSVLLEFSSSLPLAGGAWPSLSKSWLDMMGFAPPDFYSLLQAFAQLEPAAAAEVAACDAAADARAADGVAVAQPENSYLDADYVSSNMLPPASVSPTAASTTRVASKACPRPARVSDESSSPTASTGSAPSPPAAAAAGDTVDDADDTASAAVASAAAVAAAAAGPSALKFQHLLSLLKLSGYDAYVFWQLRTPLLALAPTLGTAERDELVRALRRCAEHHFATNEDDLDIFFECGRLAYQLDLGDGHEEALSFYDRSLSTFGEHPITHFNRSLCLRDAHDAAGALRALAACLRLKPDYALALKARAQLLRALPDGDDSDGAAPVVVDAKRHAAARVVTPGEGSGDEGDRPGDAEGGGWDAFVCRTHREPPVA